MAHGFGAVRSAGLEAFAQRFARAGVAALLFDYRHFGTSPGTPRGLIDIGKQRDDYRAAITYAAARRDIDPDRIALWGTSLSGGHVLTIAARHPNIAGAIMMNPFVNGPSALIATIRAAGVKNVIVLTRKWATDELRAALGRPPHRVQLVGPPGAIAVFTTPDAEPGYHAILPADDTGWEAAVPARILMRVVVDRPIRYARRTRCPLLICVNDADLVTPPRPAIRVADRAPHGTALTYPIGHFDCYTGLWFETIVGDQVDFLTAILFGKVDSSGRGRVTS
jgi:pimeloyl-ACP methyl ester carboxylesterase